MHTGTSLSRINGEKETLWGHLIQVNDSSVVTKYDAI